VPIANRPKISDFIDKSGDQVYLVGDWTLAQSYLAGAGLMNRQQLSSLLKGARFVLVSSLVFFSGGVLHAALLPPGAIQNAAAENNPVGATLVFSTGLVPFASATFTGSLRSDVFTNDASSPFGPNALTFVYQLINNVGSPDAIDRLTVSSFNGFQTDVSFTPVPGPTAPSTVSRSVNGSVIGFEFNTPGFPLTGVATPVVIQTNAFNFAPTLASIIDGSATSVASLAPVAIIPEPATITLVVGALVLLASPRKRRG